MSGPSSGTKKLLHAIRLLENATLITLLAAMVGLAASQIVLRNLFGMGITWEVVLAAEMISSGGQQAGGGLGFFIWSNYVGFNVPNIIVGMISIGIAEYPSDAEDPSDLIGKADAALYRAKQEGRDRVRIALQGHRDAEYGQW